MVVKYVIFVLLVNKKYKLTSSNHVVSVLFTTLVLHFVLYGVYIQAHSIWEHNINQRSVHSTFNTKWLDLVCLFTFWKMSKKVINPKAWPSVPNGTVTFVYWYLQSFPWRYFVSSILQRFQDSPKCMIAIRGWVGGCFEPQTKLSEMLSYGEDCDKLNLNEFYRSQFIQGECVLPNWKSIFSNKMLPACTNSSPKFMIKIPMSFEIISYVVL